VLKTALNKLITGNNVWFGGKKYLFFTTTWEILSKNEPFYSILLSFYCTGAHNYWALVPPDSTPVHNSCALLLGYSTPVYNSCALVLWDSTPAHNPAALVQGYSMPALQHANLLFLNRQSLHPP
jgi:hypothetical protein